MSNFSPLISVAMATFNGEKYLKEQIDSILSQTYKIIEIVICDDSSTDSTFDILDHYHRKFNFFKIYRNEKNIGLVKSFEKALLNCKGDYIILSDQDDYFYPEKFKILLSNIEDSLLIHSDSVIVNLNKDILHNSYFEEFKKRRRSSFKDYLYGNDVTGNSVMFKKELLNYILPFPKNIRVHDHYIAMCASYYGSIKFIPNKLQMYRQHDDNTIGVKRDTYIKFRKNLRSDIKSYIEFLKNNYFDEFQNDIFNTLFFKLILYNNLYCFNFIRYQNLFSIQNGKYFILCIILSHFIPTKVRSKIYSIIH